jgi:hypothetical protein
VEVDHFFMGAHGMGSWSSHHQTAQQTAFRFRASTSKRAQLLEMKQATAINGTSLLLVVHNTNIFHFAQGSMMGFAYRLWLTHDLLNDGMDFKVGSESTAIAARQAFDHLYFHAAGVPTNQDGMFQPWIHGLSQVIAGQEGTVIHRHTPFICFDKVLIPANHGSVFWNQKVARAFRLATFSQLQLQVFPLPPFVIAVVR